MDIPRRCELEVVELPVDEFYQAHLRVEDLELPRPRGERIIPLQVSPLRRTRPYVGPPEGELVVEPVPDSFSRDMADAVARQQEALEGWFGVPNG